MNYVLMCLFEIVMLVEELCYVKMWTMLFRVYMSTWGC